MYVNYYIDKAAIPAQAEMILRALRFNGFIAGGYARWLLNEGRKFAGHDLIEDCPDPADIDVFHCSEDVDLSPLIASIGYRFTAQALFNAWGMTRDPRVTGDKPVQLIMPHWDRWICMVGPAEVVLDNFDFRTNQFAVQFDGDLFVATYTTEALFDSMRKDLVINHVNLPVAMASRAGKYIAKGYTINIREWAKLFTAWDARPADYRERVNDILDNPSADSDELTELYRLLRIG